MGGLGGQAAASLWKHPLACPYPITVPNLEALIPADNPCIPHRAPRTEKGRQRMLSWEENHHWHRESGEWCFAHSQGEMLQVFTWRKYTLLFGGRKRKKRGIKDLVRWILL